MKILIVHNKYKEWGGEDSVVENEKQLLIEMGWEYSQFIKDNDSITTIIKKISIAMNSVHSMESKAEFKKILELERPDVVHVHNFFPVITPSIYDACLELSIPVIQTLHNFRTICPGAFLMREGNICEKCINGSPYNAVIHRCYRSSILGSYTVARLVSHHRKKNTWSEKVNRFIALTQFAKSKFVDAGFPAQKISVKSNFIIDPLIKDKDLHRENRALFVGRISKEKGADIMLSAWRSISYPLSIAGDGPELKNLKKTYKNDAVSFLGMQSNKEIFGLMRKARFLVMPSVWYEGYPVVLVEALAHGLPIICSRLGAMAEIVENRVTGLHFETGNVDDLLLKISWMVDHPDECTQMGKNARLEYEKKYTPEKNYQILNNIYQQAIEDAKNNS